MRLVYLRAYALWGTLFLVSSAQSVEFDLVTIGDPGNNKDRTYGVPSNPARYGRFGSVNYSFEMATTEVTHNQYVEFLNAVAASDPHELSHLQPLAHYEFTPFRSHLFAQRLASNQLN